MRSAPARDVVAEQQDMRRSFQTYCACPCGNMTPCGASSYVAKLRVGVLSAKRLKPLGHIFNFATLRIKCCQQHLMRQTRTSGSTRGEEVVLRHRLLSYCTATRGFGESFEQPATAGATPAAGGIRSSSWAAKLRSDG
jgi:hypothetical protein